MLPCPVSPVVSGVSGLLSADSATAQPGPQAAGGGRWGTLWQEGRPRALSASTRLGEGGCWSDPCAKPLKSAADHQDLNISRTE